MNHYSLIASVGSNIANAAKDTAQTFGFNWPHFFAQIISFSIVAFLLHRFAYQPILTVLEERRQRIADSLANADRIQQELAETQAARAEILAQANAKGNEMVEEARAAATTVLEHETQKAIQSAEQILAKAREAAIKDRDGMMTELKQEIGQLVVQTTAKVAGKVLSPEDQQRLVEEANRELAR